MTVPRIYNPVALEKGKPCRLKQDNYKYLKQVLRLEKGDCINIFDGFGHEFTAVIKGFSDDGVDLELTEELENSPRELKITLGQALPKAGKMDIIVRNAAELGADIIIPFAGARSVSRIDGEKTHVKSARWQKISHEAVRCSRSAQMTNVLPVASFEAMLSFAGSNDLKLIFWEEEDQKSIKDILRSPDWSQFKDIFIVVGPEGGFSRDEISHAKNAGFLSVSLGKQILKAETAATAIIAIIQYERGIFSRI